MLTNTDTDNFLFTTARDVQSELAWWLDADTSDDGHVFVDACRAVWRDCAYRDGYWRIARARVEEILDSYLG